jgi:hypothetical protein
MKKIITLALAVAVSIDITYAQSFTELFDSTFVNVSRTQATTSILYERVLPFAGLYKFNSNQTLVDTSNSVHFVQSYSEFYNATFLLPSSFLFDSDSLKSLISSSNSIIDIGILHYKFNTIDSTAAYQKLYFGPDSVLYENSTIATSLYVERVAFVASPLRESIEIGTVTFRFSNILQFNNTGNSIVELWVDFDDDNGKPNKTTTKSV